jgi:hypothetical protein
VEAIAELPRAAPEKGAMTAGIRALTLGDTFNRYPLLGS